MTSQRKSSTDRGGGLLDGAPLRDAGLRDRGPPGINSGRRIRHLYAMALRS